MKRLLYCMSILLTSILFGCSLSIPATHTLFDTKGTPVKNVKNIFNHLGVSISTLAQANEFTQKNLLRNGERWDTQERKAWHVLLQDKKELLLQDFTSLGMINEIAPSRTSYTYALLMGGLKERMVQRFDYLAELIQNGVTFGVIVLLGGERPLQMIEQVGLPNTVRTEAEMMSYLLHNHPILKNEKIMVINAPMIQQNDGTYIRPTTDDTIAYFAKAAPSDGSCLVVSSNPYVFRQTKVTQRMLDQTKFPTEGAGKAADKGIDIIMLMDEFARTIYEEYKQVPSNN